MNRPYVICHMASTINGKIIAENWGSEQAKKNFSGIYEQCHNSFNSRAWMCGRVTMEKDFTAGKLPELSPSETTFNREAFIADRDALSFAIAVDANGKLGWEDNQINGDHIIEVLTLQVSDEYLSFLRHRGISYIFAGETEVDFNSALNQLATFFSIKTIMLEGGGYINGSLLNDHLIDEISLLILPIADSTPQTQTTFELQENLHQKLANTLQLSSVEKLEYDVLWLKYLTSNRD